jgi:hypothetical protein
MKGFNPSRFVQPVCTNAHVMRPGAPSLPINGSKEIGLFVAVMSSLYIRLPYNEPLALVKDLFAVYRGQARACSPLGSQANLIMLCAPCHQRTHLRAFE